MSREERARHSRLSRRGFLAAAGGGGLTLILAACAPAAAPAPTSAPAAPTAAAAAPTEAPPTEAPAPTAAPAAEGAKVTITHWQHDHEARAAIVQALADEFMEQNPGVTVVFESIPYTAYFDKVVTSLEAGSGPDAFQIPSNIANEFYGRQQLTALPPEVMTKSAVESELVPWTVRLLTFGGEYYGMPTDVQVWPLFINNALAKEAGLDVAKPPKTWDDLTVWATTLTKKDDSGNLTQAGLGIAGSAYQYYYQMLSQKCQCLTVDDDYKVLYDEPWGIEAWQYITDFVTKHAVDSPQFLAGQDTFTLGKAAMRVTEYVSAGSAKLTAPDMVFTIVPTPYPPDKGPSVEGSSWSYVVSAASANKVETWSWVKFLTSADAQKKWAAGGGECPSRVAVLADTQLRSDPNIAASFDMLPTAIPMDGWGWDDVWYIRQAIWDRVILEGAKVEESVAKGAAEERALYAKKFGAS